MSRQLRRLALAFGIILGPCFVQPTGQPRALPGRLGGRTTRLAAPADELIGFGKYKGQKTLGQVVDEDPNYCKWILECNSDKSWARRLISYIEGIEASRSSPSPPEKRAKPVPVVRRLAPQIPEGPNGDFYKLPKNLLDNHQIWSCVGKEWARDTGHPYVYNMNRGWRFVGNIVAKKRLAVNLRDRSLTPDPALQCEELDASDLDDLQFARYVAALMEEESRQKPGESREVYYQGGRVQVIPKLRFRGVVLDGQPYVAPTLEQEIYAPEDWNLGKQPRTAMASLVGLKVQPLGPPKPWNQGLIVCNESMTRSGLTPDFQQWLLDNTKTPEVKTVTEQATEGDLVLTVSKNCSSESEMKLSYVARALRPCLRGQEEKLRQVKDFENWRDLPPTRMILKSSERQRTIQALVLRLGSELFGQNLLRLTGGSRFRKLQEPTLIYGNGGSSKSGAEKATRMLWDLKRRGIFEVRDSEDSHAINLQGVLFGRASEEEMASAEAILRSVRKRLESFGIQLAAEQAQLVMRPGKKPSEVQEVLNAPGLNSWDAFLFFRSGSMSESQTGKFYERSKYECLKLTGEMNGQHIASQWFSLKKEIWDEKSRSFGFGVDVTAIALLAKLGHTPWAISAKNWIGDGGDQLRPAVVGYDVCHLQDKTNPHKKHHVAAGIRVESRDSEAEPLILSRVTFQTERVHAETVPAVSLRRLIPADFARGKVVIVHRDGEFPFQELDSLKEYHAELQAEDPKTAFVLVECVKWAGGTPRLYHGKESAKAGTMFKFHEKEVLLSSTKDNVQGTANPINVRLAKVLGQVPDSFALDDYAWVQSVFDLSYLHHGSAMRRPKLPITTHFADRLAYLLASAGEDGAEWDRELAEVSGGNQQFWL